MRLFEAIIAANNKALAGDNEAGLRPADYGDSLPVAALTCIDARLNPFFPEVLGLPKEQFIWLRNAGNIITGPMSSTMRSLALACAVKGAREIAIIGHTDCMVRKTSMSKLTESFQALGVSRGALPENLTDFFGLFASEPQNVIKAVDYVRHSPLIGPKIPVHGLMVDVATGKLEWVVNGYQALETMTMPQPKVGTGEESTDAFKTFATFDLGVMKFPETKIGDFTVAAAHMQEASASVEAPATTQAMPTTPQVGPKLTPPRIVPPKMQFPLRMRRK